MLGDIEHLRPGHIGLHLLLRGGVGLARQPQRLAGLDGVGGEGSHVEDEHTGLVGRADHDPSRLEEARHGMVVAEPCLADEHIDAACGQIDVARCWRSCSWSGRELRRLCHRGCGGDDRQSAHCHQCKDCRVLQWIAPALPVESTGRNPNSPAQ